MPVKKELLDILCCPETKQGVRLMTREEIDHLNTEIKDGDVKYADGSPVEDELKEGLITESDDRIYRVDDDIPVMLVEQSIPIPSS